MSKPGPKKLPTSLKIFRGTLKSRDKNRNEPKPAVLMPRCPRDFPDEAKRIFRRLGPRLFKLGLLSELDHESFELCCLHGGLARRIALELFQAGFTDEDEHHVSRKSPLNQLLREHSDAYRKFAVMFGLSPADRSPLDIPQVKRTLREQLLDENEKRFFDFVKRT